MKTGYTILVVSEKRSDIAEIPSKLTISRNIDKVTNCNLNKTIEQARKLVPDVIIFFTHNDKNEKLFEICKIIKLDIQLKNTSIIFVFDSFDEELILLSLQTGIDDYIISPIKKIDILAHLKWCLKKSEITRNLENKINIMKEIGILDKNTGIYLPRTIDTVFSYYINLAEKKEQSLIFITMSPDIVYRNKINSEYLAKVIIKSVRSTDIVGISEEGYFCILLPETDLKGAHHICNKILKKIGDIFTVSAGICESFEDMDFEKINNFAAKALSEALAVGNKILVYNGDQYKTEPKKIVENIAPAEIKENIKINFKPDMQEIQQIPTVQDLQEKRDYDVHDVRKNWIDKIQVNKKSYETFKKDFNKKIDEVIIPAFQRVSDNIRKKYPTSIIIDVSTSDAKCLFSIKEIYKGTESVLQLINPGLTNIKIENILIKGGKQTINRYNIEMEDLTKEYLENMIEEMFNEFKIISDLERLIKADITT